MKTITALPKITNAPVQYWELDPKEEQWIYEWLQKIQSVMCEAVTHDRTLRDIWFKRRPKELPHGRMGANSYASIIGGLVKSKLDNPERNLTDAQLTALETIFTVVSEWLPGCEKIEFKKKVYRIG